MELELWLVGEGFVEISVWNRRTASSLNPSSAASACWTRREAGRRSVGIAVEPDAAQRGGRGALAGPDYFSPFVSVPF
jgi:hypothetical protein